MLKFEAEVVVGIKRASNTNEYLGEVGIDLLRSFFVGVGQSAARNLASYVSVIEFGIHRPKTGFNVA